MAGLRILLRSTMTSYWRGTKGKGFWSNANHAAFLVAGLLYVPAQLASCVATAAMLRSDVPRAGNVLLQFVLISTFLLWVFAPILAASTLGKGAGVPLSRISLLPLDSSRIYLSLGLSTAIQPIYWILAIASSLCIIPLAALPHPGLALVAGLLFFMATACFSWSAVHLEAAVFTTRRAREAAVLVLSLLMVGIYFIARLDFERDGVGFWVELSKRRILLLDNIGENGLLSRVQGLTPAAWVTSSGSDSNGVLYLLPLALLVAACAAGGAWALRRRLTHPVVGNREGRRRRSVAGPGWLAPPLGAAVEKELRYLMRTLDSLLCFATGIAATVFLLVRRDIPPWSGWAAVGITIFSEMAMPANVFGLDGRAADRYRLLPLTGREVMLSKNIAYFWLAALQALPVWIAQGIRMGPVSGLACVVGTGTLLLMHVLWGNGPSVRIPVTRGFYSFDSGDQVGGFFSAIVMLLMPLLPLGLAMGLQRSGPFAVLAGQVAIFALLLLAYRGALRGAGAAFEASAETMRARLAG